MNKIKVAQQVLDPRGSGGVTAEYNALKKSRLDEKYEFIPIVLVDFRPGINLHDIKFYYQQIKQCQPDIVHIRGAAVDGLNAVVAAKLNKKCKILVTVHGMYSDLIYISGIKRWISKNIIERLTFFLADGISCVCEDATKRKYFERYKKKMLPYVYNRIPSIDLSDKNRCWQSIRTELHIDEDAVIGIYVGRVTKEKGLTYLVEALHNLDSNWPISLKIVIVGDGDYKQEMETSVARMKHTNDIVFTGNKDNVYEYLLASDFFIQPSLHENHSIALLEACAAKLPCVASDVGGNREIINNDIGILISPANSSELAKAIVTMSGDKRNKFVSSYSKLSFSKFSNESVDKELDRVYRKVMGIYDE